MNAVTEHPYNRYLADGTEWIERYAAEYGLPLEVVEEIFTSGQLAQLARQDLAFLAGVEDFGRKPQVTL
jgi:hypothetical protein